MNQLRREHTAGVAVRLLRMKRRKCLAGRAQAGGHEDLSMVANAQEHPRACWHFPPRQGRSLRGRAVAQPRDPRNAPDQETPAPAFFFLDFRVSFTLRSDFSFQDPVKNSLEGY